MKHFVFPIAILAILFTACSVKIDSPAEASDSPFYEVTIPASLDSGAPETRAVTFDGTTSSGSFKTTEKVYVYNISKNKLLSSALSPSKNGKTCNLTGTFGKDEVSDGDALLLVYNANSLNIPYYCRFNYANQNGTQEGVVDGATASVSASVSGGKVTTSIVAAFENEQSMFRFQFTDGTNPITVSKLLIKSDKLALAYMYDPDPADPSKAADHIRVTPDSPTSDYLYAALCIMEDKADGDILTFIVTDNTGNVYKGTKAAPAGGFKNGKYYCNETPITLTYQYTKVKPTITWNSVKDGLAVEPDENDRYNIYDEIESPRHVNFNIGIYSNSDEGFASLEGYDLDITTAEVRLYKKSGSGYVDISPGDFVVDVYSEDEWTQFASISSISLGELDEGYYRLEVGGYDVDFELKVQGFEAW